MTSSSCYDEAIIAIVTDKNLKDGNGNSYHGLVGRGKYRTYWQPSGERMGIDFVNMPSVELLTSSRNPDIKAMAVTYRLNPGLRGEDDPAAFVRAFLTHSSGEGALVDAINGLFRDLKGNELLSSNLAKVYEEVKAGSLQPTQILRD